MTQPVDATDPTLADSPRPAVMGTSTDARPQHESAMDHARRLSAEEHRSSVRRLHEALRVALFAWPAFGVLDAIVVTWIEPGPLWPFVAIRLAFIPLIAGAVVWLGRTPGPAPRALTAIDLVVFGTGAACIGAMTPFYGGIGSPYGAGVAVVLAARGAFRPQEWKRGIVPVLVPALAYALVVFACAPFDRRHGDGLSDARALASFAESMAFILGVAVFTLFGGHAMWSLRRQVFEARSIGKYHLRRLLGRGGMGEVWAAFHVGLEREVAVKILRPERQDAAAVERFSREVHAMTSLTHPNTVRVFDHGVTEDGVWYYAMELLAGRDLAALVRDEGPLPPERAVFLVSQAARALAEAHARGTVHRDVKPENLFVTSAGMEGDFLKVLDFGIAKTTAGSSNATLTHVGAIVGTPAYMCPEVTTAAAATPASDVYALGAVLYFLLAGRPPFEAPTIGEVLLAHLSKPPPPLGEAVPRDLEAVVMRALAKKPAERQRDGAELARELSACACAGRWVPRQDGMVPSFAASDPNADTVEATPNVVGA